MLPSSTLSVIILPDSRLEKGTILNPLMVFMLKICCACVVFLSHMDHFETFASVYV